MQKALLLPQEKDEYFIKLNVDGLLRGDYVSRMNGYAVGRQNGWLSANDIREMERSNPIQRKMENLYLAEWKHLKQSCRMQEPLQERQEVICHRFKKIYAQLELGNTMLRSGTICYCLVTGVKQKIP